MLLWGLRIYSAGRSYLVPFLPISANFIHTSMLALVQSFLSSIKLCEHPESSVNLVCLGTTEFISSWHTINVFGWLCFCISNICQAGSSIFGGSDHIGNLMEVMSLSSWETSVWHTHTHTFLHLIKGCLWTTEVYFRHSGERSWLGTRNGGFEQNERSSSRYTPPTGKVPKLWDDVIFP